MGNNENVFKLHDAGTMLLPEGVVIAANRAEIENLSAEMEASALLNAILLALAPGEPLPELNADLKALVLEVDPLDPASLDRLSKVRSTRSDVPVIAAIGRADLDVVQKLVRLGVADVVRLPLSQQELSSRLIDVLANTRPAPDESKKGTLFAIQGAVGGSGATTVLTHLAKALVDIEPGKKVCVVDLDLQTGSVSPYLGLERSTDIGSLLDAGQRLDNDLLTGALITTEYGFQILAAPEVIRPLDSVDLNHILRVVELLRTRFDYVLLDLPAAWTNWSLSLALASNRVMIVSGATISSLRQAKRKIDLLTGLGLQLPRLAVIGNKLERRLFKTIGLNELEATLGCQVAGGLTFEGNELAAGQDIGRLMHDLNPRSRFLAEMTKLAQQMLAMETAS